MVLIHAEGFPDVSTIYAYFTWPLFLEHRDNFPEVCSISGELFKLKAD